MARRMYNKICEEGTSIYNTIWKARLVLDKKERETEVKKPFGMKNAKAYGG